jgi:hypothetical protein
MVGFSFCKPFAVAKAVIVYATTGTAKVVP